MKLDKLIHDKFIYPRGSKSQKTIDTYMEALSLGAKFPPIKIQKVLNYTDAKMAIKNSKQS